ncbi:hypothetical protein [Planctomicrobium sp. SH664]|uniref:hypothetical protein n=1 Tax=Planctomicrobium sp. SH664 TaxID=3448125 RepID=UPI003F5BD311
MSTRNVVHCTVSALWLTLLAGGCSSMNLFHRDGSTPTVTASAENPVIDMVCVWENATGTGLDNLPARGFAGKLMFFTHHDPRPVRIAGAVSIYLFDDHGEIEEQSKPIHIFNFDDVAFQNFFQDTKLGGAYQLFIPYTRGGAHHANCSLRVRYLPTNGTAVYSKMVTIAVPGTDRPKPNVPLGKTAGEPGNAIQQVNHQVVTPEPVPSKFAQESIVIPSDLKTPPPAAADAGDKVRLQSKLAEISKTQTGPASAPSPLTTITKSEPQYLRANRPNPLATAANEPATPVTEPAPKATEPALPEVAAPPPAAALHPLEAN